VAISVLDVRDTMVAPAVRVPLLRLVPTPVTASASTTRRLPVTVLAAGLIGIVESVGLLTLALTGLDELLAFPVRLPGWLVAVGLLVTAGWIVLSAGGGAALIDGAGRRLVRTVAYGELALLGGLIVVTTTSSVITAAPAGLSLPVLLLMAVAVPVGKLLLVGSPSAVRWIAQGPRVRERRVDPVAAHRLVATLTLGLIGVSLVAVAALVPAPGGVANEPASAVFTQH
jgi:hypothetical protein